MSAVVRERNDMHVRWVAASDRLGRYRAGKWSYMGKLHNAIGYSDEKIEMFLAEELTHEGATLDAGETLDVFTAGDWLRLSTLRPSSKLRT